MWENGNIVHMKVCQENETMVSCFTEHDYQCGMVHRWKYVPYSWKYTLV